MLLDSRVQTVMAPGTVKLLSVGIQEEVKGFRCFLTMVHLHSSRRVFWAIVESVVQGLHKPLDSTHWLTSEESLVSVLLLNDCNQAGENIERVADPTVVRQFESRVVAMMKIITVISSSARPKWLAQFRQEQTVEFCWHSRGLGTRKDVGKHTVNSTPPSAKRTK